MAIRTQKVEQMYFYNRQKLSFIYETDWGFSTQASIKTESNRPTGDLYFPRMNLMITGKCNLNCLHCFNAKDNAPLNTELSFEDVISILDQANEIGVHGFTLTGGEPLVHRRFLDIVREIYKRDMMVFELNTNGLMLTQEMLDEFKKIGCSPLIKISFDGIGYHNWIRQHPKAEEMTIKAFKLCKDNGFRVKAQTQVNRKNLSSMMETAKLLNGMGVDEMRIIRTTEAPRWEKNSPQSSLTIQEYYAISCSKDEFNIRIPMCKGNRGMIAVSSHGEVVPCLQMSGYFLEKGISLGNCLKTPLKELVQNSEYVNLATAPILTQILRNEKCANCKYYKACTGGCPALGLLYSKDSDFFHEDITKCYFFENGYYEKVKDTLPWHLTNPLDID